MNIETKKKIKRMEHIIIMQEQDIIDLEEEIKKLKKQIKEAER